jgi:hypothetical protein
VSDATYGGAALVPPGSQGRRTVSIHPRNEEFGDPVIVPGPNLRSRFTATETVADGSEFIDDSAATRCPSCGRLLPAATMVCPTDGAVVIELPGSE